MSVQSLNPQLSNYLKAPPKIPPKKKHYPWPAVASLFIPGTGQFIKGDNKKGKRDLGIQIGIVVAGVIGAVAVVTQAFKKSFAANFEASLDSKSFTGPSAKKIQGLQGSYPPLVIAFGVMLSAAATINRIHSAYDAYKAVPVKKTRKT